MGITEDDRIGNLTAINKRSIDRVRQDLLVALGDATDTQANNLQHSIGHLESSHGEFKLKTQAELDEAKRLISAEAARAISAENENADAIQSETSRAAGKEGELSSRIDNEVVRAQKAEQQLSFDTSSEVTRATHAEQMLQNAINVAGTDLQATRESLTKTQESTLKSLLDDIEKVVERLDDDLEDKTSAQSILNNLKLVDGASSGLDASRLAGHNLDYFATKQDLDNIDEIVGPQGPAGPQGDDGIQGPVGPMGANGRDGQDGQAGPAGPRGERGAQGHDGIQGLQGASVHKDLEVYKD